MTRQHTTIPLSRLLPLCLVLLSLGCGGYSDRTLPLDTVGRVREAALNPENYGRPVHVEGVVTYYDPEWHLLFLHDSKAGLFINIPEPVSGVDVGQRIVVQGKLAPSNLGVEDLQLRVEGPAPMPAAHPLNFEPDPLRLHLSEWVEVKGMVRQSAFEDGRLTLSVVDGVHRAKVRILDHKHVRPVSLIGAKVRITGVSAAATDDKGNVIGTQVFVPSLDNLRSEGKLVSPYDSQPAGFSQVLHPQQAGELVHLAGTVVEQSADHVLALSDGKLTVKALLADNSQFAPGDGVELLGFSTSPSAAYQIEEATARLTAPRKPLDEDRLPGTLHKLGELKSLSVESAARQLPVDAQGVVTFLDPSMSLLFVQDDTAGVYVDIHNDGPELHPGDRVRVTGVSAPGDYAPIIAHPVIKVLGHGPLPKPRALSLQVLASGTSDGSWVQIAGIVRSVRQLQTQHFFKLAIGDHSFDVQFPGGADILDLRGRLLDSEVRVNAVCGTIFNEKRQLTGIKFLVPESANVQIVEPAPTLAGNAVRPIITLLRFDPLNISVHRVRIRGVVTLQDGKGNFYAQDSSGGIYVVPEQATPLNLGQVVEVSGFPVAGPEGPYLDDASLDPTDTVNPLPPARVAADETSVGLYKSQLVKVEGRLLDQVMTADHDVMILQSGPMVFRSSVPRGHLPSGVRRGSVLELTGVLQSEGPVEQPSYRLALRSAADVRVVKAASWWTPEHSVGVALGVTALVLLALLALVVNGYCVRSHQATHDALTGLQNRKTTLEYLERQMARAVREQSSVGVILAHVDHFKKINDTYGHLAGDAVLKRIAGLLATDLRPYDSAGRYAGGDFIIVVPNCDATVARQIAERVRFRVQQEWFASVIPPEALPITCSFGIAIANDTSWSVDSLLTSADCALYDAKNTGRNKTVVANLTPVRAVL